MTPENRWALTRFPWCTSTDRDRSLRYLRPMKTPFAPGHLVQYVGPAGPIDPEDEPAAGDTAVVMDVDAQGGDVIVTRSKTGELCDGHGRKT